MSLGGKKFQAFPKQDHQSHMKSHLQFMSTLVCRNNPAALAALQTNCMQHIQLMAAEQVQVEFAEELKKLQQLQQVLQQMQMQAGNNPQAMQQLQQNPQIQQIQKTMQDEQQKMEGRKAVLISEFMEDYAKAEKEVLNNIENDPLLKLKDRELDLKARDNMRKEEEGEDKLNLEKMKMLQSRELAEEKMEENDKHQKLRASVSLAKDGIKNMQATIKEGN